MSQYEVGHWIDGAVSRGHGNGERQQDIYNPATGAVQGKLLLGSVADLDAAVASATRAAKAWGQTPALATAASRSATLPSSSLPCTAPVAGL
jgi:malonate-semialdehyde dehydrogenase (acetylating)/methylmalonate-semialdehyde dehydrogenase